MAYPRSPHPAVTLGEETPCGQACELPGPVPELLPEDVHPNLQVGVCGAAGEGGGRAEGSSLPWGFA